LLTRKENAKNSAAGEQDAKKQQHDDERAINQVHSFTSLRQE
jgi:hypothetical protein